MNIIKRLKNLWEISEIDPKKYSIGFKFTDWVEPQYSTIKTVNTIGNSENKATIIKLRPKDEIDEILKNNE